MLRLATGSDATGRIRRCRLAASLFTPNAKSIALPHTLPRASRPQKLRALEYSFSLDDLAPDLVAVAICYLAQCDKRFSVFSRAA